MCQVPHHMAPALQIALQITKGKKKKKVVFKFSPSWHLAFRSVTEVLFQATFVAILGPWKQGWESDGGNE